MYDQILAIKQTQCLKNMQLDVNLIFDDAHSALLAVVQEGNYQGKKQKVIRRLYRNSIQTTA